MKRIFGLVILLAAIATPALADDRPFSYGALVTAHVLDVDSTYRALGNGAVEGNGFAVAAVNHPLVISIEKAGVTAFAVWASESLRESGHPKVARILTWSLTGAFLAIAAHNYKVGGQR